MGLRKIVFKQNSLILESCRETQDISLFLLGFFFQIVPSRSTYTTILELNSSFRKEQSEFWIKV